VEEIERYPSAEISLSKAMNFAAKVHEMVGKKCHIVCETFWAIWL
jgi:hypothetical protein